MFSLRILWIAWVVSLLIVAISGQVQAELRDPTKPYGYSPQVVQSVGLEEEIILDGIIKGPQGMSAVINGKRFRVGDKAHGRTVIAVEGDRVVLEVEGKQQTLYLLSGKIKTLSVTADSELAGGQ